MGTKAGSRGAVLAVCGILAALVWAVFGQTTGFDFLNFDDDIYVGDNPMVKAGLTMKGVVWAFTSNHAANWHPISTLSHMLDCQLYGLNPAGHHLTNVVLHGAAAILLFLVLRRMTGELWPSAFVAAVFACHPLRAESVAWVAERKDVLSGMMFVLTLGAYVAYVGKAEGKERGERSCGATGYYFLTLGLFALGVMSKPMLVTVPFVLLLLDYWPLGRFKPNGGRFAKGLVWEKLPMVALSAAACAVTLYVQRFAIRPTATVPFPLRLGNAAVSSAAYVWQMIWPRGLAAFYPYPTKGIPAWELGLSLAELAAVSIAAFMWRRQRPYLIVGWLWYLGMLVPVSGLVQVGTQARADRYTYLPQIGLYVVVTWAVAEATASWRNRRRVLGGLAAIIVVALMVCGRQATACWKNSQLLWAHALACTADNALAEGNLGNALLHEGRAEEAIVHSRRALEIGPDNHYDENALGFALLQRGLTGEAIQHFEQALRLQPGFAATHNNLGLAFFQSKRVDEAIAQFAEALKLEPGLPDTHCNLGAALVQRGRVEEAVEHYEKALALRPDYAGAANNLAWVLATFPKDSVRNGPKAVTLAEKANQLSRGGNVIVLRTLSAAYAEAGRFPEAIQTAGQALELAQAQGNTAWVAALQTAINLYQAGRPLREGPQEL